MQANDAWSAVAELAASQHGAFHARQAAELGLTNRRLRTAETNGLIHRASSRVLVFASAPPSWRQRLITETLIGGVASHQAAAELHGLDGFDKSIIELTANRGRRPTNRSVRLHHYLEPLTLDQTTSVDSIRCTTIPVTLVHLAISARRYQVEKALDSALRIGVKETEIRRVLEEMWRPGPTGLGPLARILDDPARINELPDSWFERRIAKALRIKRLPPPVLQYELRTGRGVRRFDLAYPNVKLAIEGHSRRYHWGHRAEEADNLRDLEVSQLGWEIIYVSWSMLQEPLQLASTIARIYQTRQIQLRAA